MKVYKSAEYSRFHCIASACPDSCCHGWAVDIDPETAKFYQSLPGDLGDKLRSFLKEEPWGTVLSLEENRRCPMWREDGLCRIHAELGEAALSQVCTDFPRLRHDYGSFQELGLELSCPEAARLILKNSHFALTEETLPGGDVPDYDQRDMDILLRTRSALMGFIDRRTLPIRETLAVTLLYGYSVQEELDGGEGAILDISDCLAAARGCAGAGDSHALLAFFQGLEILSPDWAARLEGGICRAISEDIRSILRYFLGRYYLQAVSDLDIVCRVKLAVISCLVIALLGGDLLQTAQTYSKEIENDPENVEAILDGAYTAPALTDANLLGLLLNNF